MSSGVLQNLSKFTGDHPCRSENSIKSHSKNSSIYLHSWECRLLWVVLRLMEVSLTLHLNSLILNTKLLR